MPQFNASIEDIFEQAVNDGFTFLNISNQHIYHYNTIPLNEFHRDPFDRLLIATAFTENAIILTADEKFNLYNDIVQVKW